MKSDYDIIVVGAGPAGSMAAKFAAEKGVSVLLMEKDRDVGYPVRCGEAVKKETIDKFITPNKKWIAAEINKFSFTSPDFQSVEVEFEDVKGYVLERRIFDYELAKLASEAGAEVVTRTYVNGLIFENNKVAGVKYDYRGEQKELRAKIVIAADGVESRVGRWAGLTTHIDFREMESCVQITASNISCEKNCLYFYFGKNIAPNGYFWIFPKGNNIANVGLGISGDQCKKKSTLKYLNEFLEKHYPGISVLTQIAGGVPCSVTLDKITAPGIMLTGDAARQVNPLSGGGIGSGMIGGSICGRIAGEAVKKNNLDLIFSYEKEWYNSRGKLHLVYNRIKESIYNFDDAKFNAICASFRKVPMEKRTIRKLFTTALIHKPSLFIDIAKAFTV